MKNDLTDITIVLDRSGSMGSVRSDTIGGFNQFIADQKKSPGLASISLIQFDNGYEPLYVGKPIADAPDLTMETFVPRGGTALLDAIGKTIVTTGKRLSDTPESDRAGKVVFVIITDGEENSSNEFTLSKVNELISHQRDIYKWQFVFLGANQDAIATAASVGISAGNSISYASNAIGTRSVLHATSSLICEYRNSLSGVVPAYSDKDREESAGAQF